MATILEGSIRRVGSKVHMNAQLIDARTDEHLWAETYDGDTGDIFALQAKLAQQIAGALKATLTGTERALIERRPTQNQEAYDLYLRARAMNQDQGERGAPEDFERTIKVYEQAIAKDPSFALAQAQVALVHAIMYWFGNLDPTPARAAKMKSAVDAAIHLAPDAPETHLALGAYHYRVKRDWVRALAEFRIAEDGLPNDAQVTFWLAITQRRLGNWSESRAYFERSVALNPRDFAPLANLVGFLSDLRQFEKARDATTRFLNYFPSDRLLLLVQANMKFALDGDRPAHAAALEALPRLPADPTGAGDRYRAALLRGDYAAADKVLAEPQLTRLSEGRGGVIGDPPA
ncbi:MAG: tetratricopeptide repeat protein, partial [Oleiharenicola lentus]